MSDETRLPFAGLRVVDAATFIAAPFAASLLGEFGAEVLKIEALEGDPLRRFGVASRRADTLCWLSEARNKHSLPLDLRTPAGADRFKRLCGAADVLCESFRPGTLEAWGLGPEILTEINPRLIILRVSGYGQTGPYRNRPGFARVAHAFGGLAHLTGEQGGAPLTPGSTSLADYLTGLFGAFGVLAALRERDRSGRGQVVDIGLYESVLRVLDDMAPAFVQDGTVRGRQGVGAQAACPHGHFQAADGNWVALACSSDRIFSRFANLIGRPDLSETYGRAEKRLEGRVLVDAAAAAWVAARPAREAVEACNEAGVPVAFVNTIADILADPHVAERENFVTLDGVTAPNTTPRLSRTPGRVLSLGPALGEGGERVSAAWLDEKP